MHKQMLARYDAERVAIGLDPVVPLRDYKEPIPEGYLPNKYLLRYNKESKINDLQDKYDYRLPYSKIVEKNSKEIDELSALEKENRKMRLRLGKRQRMILKILILGLQQSTNQLMMESFTYVKKRNDPDKLGRTINPDQFNHDKDEDQEWKNKYGMLHIQGHITIGNIVGNKEVINKIKQNQTIESHAPKGLILNVSITPKDPAFFRWHRLVDETFNRGMEVLKPCTFNDAPAITIKSCDILLAFKDQLERVCPDGIHDRWQKYGETNFGNPNFPSTDILQTKIVPRKLKTPDKDKDLEIQHFYSREFYYFFRMKNNTKRNRFDPSTQKLVPISEEKDVTFRVFIVPEILAHDRKQWIEIDKFKYRLNATGETIISRACELSSVIRKPAQKEKKDFDDTPGDDFPNDYCGCGWPYHLLLPCGTKDGMKFKLLVFISDWSIDKVSDSTEEGSISLCGRKFVSNRPVKYPDTRDMGYPFDRPYAGHSLNLTFTKPPIDPKTKKIESKSLPKFPPEATSNNPENDWIDNLAMRDFTIQWDDKGLF
ncbi:Di-copper centre-containing protein [Gigaspora rosea]|uniref:Di-copper centre-containing protein n=1 Tax=Gigaspora rosea TaxID=44941 RepID=A0A397W936_9GLOM|nr:Di-copper centre-containing protein [Gigaspora rosea]